MVNLQQILQSVGVGSETKKVASHLMNSRPIGSRVGAEAAQTPQGQMSQIVRALRQGKDDVTFRPMREGRKLNGFTH